LSNQIFGYILSDKQITVKDQNLKALDWKLYEDITKYIYETLGSKFGIKIIGHGNNFKVTGKSGVKHQIDVLTEQFQNGRTYRTAIECKYIKKKVTKDTVMKLHEEMSDANIDAGIIVCKAGYTRDTLTYAEHLGIKLVTLQEAGETVVGTSEEVELGTVDFAIQATLTRPKILSIDFGDFIISNSDDIFKFYFESYAAIVGHDGVIVPITEYILRYTSFLNSENQLWKTFRKDFAVKGNLRRAGFHDQPINRIVITGFLCKTSEHSIKSFNIVDQVWMIMEEIFERNAYRLTKSGILFKYRPD